MVISIVISIIVIVICVIISIINIKSLKNIHKKNTEIDNYNKIIIDKNKDLLNEKDILTKELEDKHNQLNDLQDNITKTLDNQTKLSDKAFNNYFKTLENKYKEVEEEYDKNTETMKEAYSELQLKLMREADECKTELDKLRSTRAAAIEAQRKEKEIKEKSTFYCLQISDPELKDIAVLESIKPKLNAPRVLSMLIWQTFWRTPMTQLCNNVLGKDIKTGIYKITNQQTDECYIGQAVNVADRWKSHAKAGLGIDTPTTNKLYKAMQEYGIWNFSWELVEECSKEELDEKEKFYIDLYQAKSFGYNKTNGNK